MKITSIRIFTISWATALLAMCMVLDPAPANATKYGYGYYGRCQYETCAISLASSGSVAVNITPATTGVTCTVAKDTVTVTTSSSTGYNVTLIDGDTTNTLVASGSTIPASSGTFSNPVALSANTWGYRVDGAGGFGAGPTSAVTNGSIPSVTFAGVQASNGTAATIVNSTSAATTGVSTSVWYGECVNASQTSGSYSDGVVYTALIN